jgi:RNA polymerase sigma factor (sigma-70 family)
LHTPDGSDADRRANLTACELIAECARKLDDAAVWEEFYLRYRRKILTYLWRTLRMSGGRPHEFLQVADDWVQEVFAKLVKNNGRIIRSFRGTTDVSVNAFLASIAVSTVADQRRSQRAGRRRSQLVPFEDIQEAEIPSSRPDTTVSTLLDLIDVEKALKEDGESKNPERDLLIFQLHFVEGLTPREMSSIPGFKLTVSGLEKVLTRLKSRLSRRASNKV